MQKIFTEISLGGLRLPNRIAMPAMCMYSAETDGKITPFHLTHYGTRAQGGVGFIIIEATAVDPRGRISKNDLGIWNDDQIPGLTQLVDLVHNFGAKIAIQLAHAGRKAGVGKGISSSAIQFSDHYPVPDALLTKEIPNVIETFQAAAQRSLTCGFDAIEIHGAHGYLINQFLSPLINTRTDDFRTNPSTGSPFLKKIVQSIKQVFPKCVGLRISAEDYEPSGLHPKQYVNIIKSLQTNPETALDFIDVSSGGVTSAFPSNLEPGYQMNFANILKHGTGIPVIGGGLITEFDQANSVLDSEQADLVWLGRELLRNPYWVLQAADYYNVGIRKPLQYKRGEPYFKSNVV